MAGGGIDGTHGELTTFYRSMLATDFVAYGVPSSLRNPRAASCFETSRNDSCPALGRRLRRRRAMATTSGLVSQGVKQARQRAGATEGFPKVVDGLHRAIRCATPIPARAVQSEKASS